MGEDDLVRPPLGAASMDEGAEGPIEARRDPASEPSVELPQGVVTFLLTDIEGSTELWESNRAVMGAALARHAALIEAMVSAHGGRLIKAQGEGDSTLSVFPRASNAVNAALGLQQALLAEAWPAGCVLRTRAALHTGEAELRQGDYYGQTMNRAARLRALARGGQVLLSRATAELVADQLPAGAELADVGARQLKGLSRAEHVFALVPPPPAAMEQHIRFCVAPDGVRLAFATHGQGPPLVRVATWLTHLEFDWQSPLWRHWLEGLADGHTVVRYDERGCGLSDRDVEGVSLDGWVSDLETVVDAANLDRFALLGASQGGPVAIAYAVRHPERVTRLVLYGTYARGRFKRGLRPDREEAEAWVSMVRAGWGRGGPAFRRAFTTMYVPGATLEQMSWFDELQRISTSPETAARIRLSQNELDVADIARRVTVPTLILHARDDLIAPYTEGRLVASLIPSAQFVPLEGRNHILLADEPAWPVFLRELHAFLAAS
jgi:class 3 adenylate cyclase/pimeloyl-ACP methyl ester carboxylesterase